MRILKIFCLSIFFTLLCSIPALAVTISGVDDPNVPTDCWVFTQGDTLSRADGEQKSFSALLHVKTAEIEKELENNAQGGFKTSEITGSLDGMDASQAIYLWSKDLNADDLGKKTTGNVTINMKVGGTDYHIYIPRGLRDGSHGLVPVNREIISYTLSAINNFKFAVKEGVLAGGVATGYNVYSGYSDAQLLVGTAKSSTADLNNGLLVLDSSGGSIFGASGSSKIKYNLDYFHSPLFGKLDDSSDIKKIPKTNEAWSAKIQQIKYNIGSNKLEVIIDSDYLKFMQITSDARKSVRDTKGIVSSNSNGVPAYTNTGSTFTPKDLVDYSMRVVAPTKFTQKGTGKFGLEDAGFVLIPDIRISLFDSHLYTDPKTPTEKATDLGSMGDFSGLSGDYLALYNYNIAGKTVGAVVPLKYREAVVNTSIVDKESSTYLTGRDVIFNNNYSGNLDFSSANKDMMDISNPVSGKSGAVVRDFAFAPSSDAMKQDSHKSVGEPPITKFEFNYSFISGSDAGNGFVILRNNTYIKNDSLITWLATDAAQALKGIKAEELYKKISGVVTVTQDLTYEDWKKMQVIRAGLERDKQGLFASVIRISALMFGIFLIIYSQLMIMAYFVDIFNTFFDLSLLNILTFHRMYPVASGEEIDYIRSSKGGLKYVNFFDVLKTAVIGSFVGILFISYTPVLKFFLAIYMYLMKLLGGI